MQASFQVQLEEAKKSVSIQFEDKIKSLEASIKSKDDIIKEKEAKIKVNKKNISMQYNNTILFIHRNFS
jgi:hypothetical protein